MDQSANTTGLSPLLSVRELSEYLNVPVESLYLWRQTGKGPRSFKAGLQIRYRLADVESWIEEQSTEGEAART